MAKNQGNEHIYVTKTLLPALDQYMEYMRNIFNSHNLTNQGVYARKLEKELTDFLHVPALSLCANGTLALQLAIRLLGINNKKVITTPFTYVATLSSLLWEGCEPLLADIDPDTLCINPSEVERLAAEYPDAAGIAAVHVYGNACDVSALADIARRHELATLYDAAHAFGSELDGKSLYDYGDASIGSFHATKLFHTVEGGCIVVPNPDEKKRISLLRAFGHSGDNHYCLGINAKMTEVHAAMGLCLLPLLPEAIKRRGQLAAIYDKALDMNGKSGLKRPVQAAGLKWNHAYYPVIFPDHAGMLRVMASLEKENIHPRRYFYPSLSRLPYIKNVSCPVAEDMAERVLCLPFWSKMDEELIHKIARIIMKTL